MEQVAQAASEPAGRNAPGAAPPAAVALLEAIDRDGTLTLLGSTPFRNPTGLGPVDARLSPDGNTLFVVDGGTSQVSAFRVHGGSLTELPSSPTALPAGATPFGIVVS